VAFKPALVPDPEPRRDDPARSQALVESYRRLAAVFHEVLSEQRPEALLDLIADTLGELIPHQDLHIYEVDEKRRQLVPVFAKGPWEEEVLASSIPYGQGITGWAVAHGSPVLSNEAHLDPRVEFVPGTPPDPEALITVPLIARGSLKGALNIYRVGEGASFNDEEFELARWFGDAAALALDNAQIRARLEHLAHTDSLTGLYNHRYFHERLRAELSRAARAHDSLALMMLDIDDFKRVNDVCGHAEGDEVLQTIAAVLRTTVRASDVVCRVGGEEFAVILPSCGGRDAVAMAARLKSGLNEVATDASGRITLSIGVALGPEHAMNARELLACAEAAMMTAKMQGKDQVVVFEESEAERPQDADSERDLRSIAHLKLLQSLARKLNRLNDVTEIGEAIVDELRVLVDYNNCIVYLVDGDRLRPVAVRGQLEGSRELLEFGVGEGLTGLVAETGKPMLVANTLESPVCKRLDEAAGAESLASVPLRHGQRVIGVITMAKLGVGQFDDDDLRLLEVVGGHASVALENARLYEAMRREAENARTWLEFSDALSAAGSFQAICEVAVSTVADLLGIEQCSLWLEDRQTSEFRCAASAGYVGKGVEEITKWRHPAAVGDRFLAGRRTPFVVQPADVRAYFFGEDDSIDIRVIACAPLPAGHGVRGWISLRQADDDASVFTEDRLRLLDGIAYRLSQALQKTALFDEQQEAANVASALLDFARALVSPDRATPVHDRIVERTAETLGVQEASLWLQDLQSGEIGAVAVFGVDGREREQMLAFRYSPEISARFIDVPGPFVYLPADHPDVPAPAENRDHLIFAIAPFRFEGGRMGFLIAGASPETAFDERQLKLLAGLADQTKLAIQHGSADAAPPRQAGHRPR
jgi:diguanylate cyclase (GGDEF)-like protein